MNTYIIQGMEYSPYYNGYRSFRVEIMADNIEQALSIANIKYPDSIIESVSSLKYDLRITNDAKHIGGFHFD